MMGFNYTREDEKRPEQAFVSVWAEAHFNNVMYQAEWVEVDDDMLLVSEVLFHFNNVMPRHAMPDTYRM